MEDRRSFVVHKFRAGNVSSVSALSSVLVTALCIVFVLMLEGMSIAMLLNLAALQFFFMRLDPFDSEYLLI